MSDGRRHGVKEGEGRERGERESGGREAGRGQREREMGKERLKESYVMYNYWCI